MNRTLKLAFGAVLGSALFASASGQNFPDVPEYHWAYAALLNMKREGILVGYPDGLFRGGRPTSRYELASAINAAYLKLRGMVGGVTNQIDALNSQIDALKGYSHDEYLTASDLDSLRSALEQLRSDLNAMKGWGDDIANLKRLADMFERDLAAMGVDVEAMKRDLSDLAGRLDNMPKPAVEIHGDANFVVHLGHSTDDLFGITVDLRPTGFGRGSYLGEPVGITRDLTIGHEAAFRFNGTNDEGPQWHATLVVGNLLGFSDLEGGGGFDGIGFGINTMYGNQSMVAAFLPFREQNTRVYFQDFGVNFDTSVWGQNFALELGRFGYQTGAYFFQRIDNTPYFVNDRWDNGNWYMDGGLVSFDWGAANLDVWAGRNSERFDSGENIVFGSAFHNDIWPMTAGPQGFLADGLVMIDQSLGFNLDFGLGDNGDLMLTYMFLDSNTIVPDPVSGADVNRVVVFGGELEYSLNDNLHLYGGYSQSDLMENSSSVLTDDNSAWWAELGWYQDSWEAMLGYREIQPYFGAPGDWGRVGFLWNPVDIQGFFAMLAFLDKPNVNLGAYFYEGATGMILGTDDTIVGYTADVTWCAGGPWEFLLGWERVEYDFAGTPFFGAADDNVVNWYRIGFNYSPGGDQALRFLYEISDYDDGPGGGILGSDFRGGLITTQWSVKF